MLGFLTQFDFAVNMTDSITFWWTNQIEYYNWK